MPAVDARPEIEEDLGGEARVTPLELFFDLVFVFAITQVTGMISDQPTAGLALDADVIAAAALAIGVSATLWWAYFDVVAPVAERKLEEAKGVARAVLARDSYSYLHLPMLAGIILFAVGVKKTLGHSDDGLATVPAACLAGGVALYLLAHIAFRLRNVGSVNRQRLLVAVALLAFVPAATELPALVSLTTVFALCAALIAYEAIRFADDRERVRRAA